MNISTKAGGVAPSVTLEISAKAKALKAEGKSIVAFTAGEPDFNTPDYIIKAAKLALDKGFTKYTPTPGIIELRKAICEKFKKDNGLDYTPSQIVVSNGAKSSLYHALFAIVNEGDEVIIPAPYWITYAEQIALCGGKCVVVNTSEKSGYKLVKNDFEKAITPKTRCVILNSPCNPTGVVYTRNELKDIADVCEKYGIEIISDEIYEKLIFDGEDHVSIASLSSYAKEHTIVINGVSKTYSMTGWRIGYLAAPENVAKAISNVQGHTTSNACSVSQYAALAAIMGGERIVEEMVNTFDQRRKLFVELMEKLPNVKIIEPKGAFYIFADFSYYYGKSVNAKKIEGSVSLADALLDAGVAVIPGLAFGADNFIRLAYAVNEFDIKEGVFRIQKFLSQLN